jgi:c-di-GMP-binding flagellar brake protein YcgR
VSKPDKNRSVTGGRPESVYPEIGSDRRIRSGRVNVSFPITATHRGHPIQGHLWAVNLSWSGMMIATNFPLNARDELTLEFRLPGSDIPITTRARVVHRTHGRVPEEATMVGVAFVETDPNIQRMLSGFVLEHLSTD